MRHNQSISDIQDLVQLLSRLWFGSIDVPLDLLGTYLCKINSVFFDFEAEFIEFEGEGEGDHVHLLFNDLSKSSLSRPLGSLKGISSRYIRESNYPEI